MVAGTPPLVSVRGAAPRASYIATSRFPETKMAVVPRRGGPMALDYITELPDDILLQIIEHVGPDDSQSSVRDQASFAATCTRVCRLYREDVRPDRILLRDEQDDIITYSVKEQIYDFSYERDYYRIFGRIGFLGDRWQDANWRPPKYSPDKWAIFVESAKSNLRRRTYHLESDDTLSVTHEDIKLFHKAAMKFARSIRRRQLRVARKNAAVAVA